MPKNTFVKIELKRPIQYSKNVELRPGIHILNKEEFYSKWFVKGLILSEALVVLEEIKKKTNKPDPLVLDEKVNFKESSKPLVSICCLTYNHKHCVEDALAGFLMQKTDFPFEIIVCDDASTDSTAQIVKKYSDRYSIVKPVFNTQNQFSKTKILPFATHLFPQAKGKYIAECDGDDYWTDSLKLQKQVNFLEKRKDCSMCYNDLLIYYMDKDRVERAYKDRPRNYTQKELIGFENFSQWLHPSTKMWRNVFKGNEKDFEICWGDNATNVHMGLYGGCGYVEDIKPSVFRRFHGNNMWSCMTPKDTYEKTLEIFKRLAKFMVSKHKPEYARIREDILQQYIKHNTVVVVKPVVERVPVKKAVRQQRRKSTFAASFNHARGM